MIIIFFAIVIIMLVVCFSSKPDTAVSNTTSRAAPRPIQVKAFSESNPDDIIKTIGLLAECVANKGDSSFDVVFENDNRSGDNRRIIIHACIDDWGSRFMTERGSNRWCWIPAESAAFLDTVPFTFNGDNVTYTYYTELNKPILYKNRGFSAVKQGIARASYSNRHEIRTEETYGSISFVCL